MKYFSLFLLLLLGCADLQDHNNDSNLVDTEKSLLGSECSWGCIWSSYAVSSGVQKLTHYCDGLPCHCVVQGDIYSSCNDDISTNPQTLPEISSPSPQPTPQVSYNNYNSIKGNRIADEAYYEARSRNTVGWCYNAVADAVERVTGPFLWGSHAYQSASQFASSAHFYESFDSNLRSLPAGAIVVWGKGSSPSGHISVSLGNGQEASDHITSQMTYHYGGAPARIFLPR